MSLLHAAVTLTHPAVSVATHLIAASSDPPATPGASGGSALPDSSPLAPPGVLAPVQRLVGFWKWGALTVCILALIAAGALIAANSRRGEGAEHAGRIGQVLAGLIVISGAASIVGFIIG